MDDCRPLTTGVAQQQQSAAERNARVKGVITREGIERGRVTERNARVKSVIGRERQVEKEEGRRARRRKKERERARRIEGE